MVEYGIRQIQENEADSLKYFKFDDEIEENGEDTGEDSVAKTASEVHKDKKDKKSRKRRMQEAEEAKMAAKTEDVDSKR
ncbi:unnamed protein product [Rodentolepis nana]|uniref:Uncharacterized protein n=1 Tax=Rodentolepis nana TaxID=102285 RepID=A0A0R3TYY7_RODNA|nr:unnamed protein product [Rodentolepis nana]